VMAAPIISILLDSFEESAGSHAPRVILFGTILAIIPVIPEVPIAPADPIVAPEVGVVSVISPTRVLDLVDYSSSSDSDLSEDSLRVSSGLPLVSPFLCTDDSKVDSESEPAEQRPERHESLTPSSEFPLAPVVAPLGIRRRPVILVRPVGPFPARRLAWRRVSHHSLDSHSSLDFTSDSSSSSSSSDSSSDISSGSLLDSLSDSSSVHSSGQSHSGPSTRVASPRLVDPSVRTPRCSDAFMRWRSAPLSTLYPPTTSESSLDSSSERLLDSSLPFAGPSHKRCRSPATLVLSSTHVSRSIASALADLSPCKRFRDSYLSEVSGEEHIEMGTADVETIADLGISEGGTMEIDVDPLAIGDISEPTRGDAPDLEGTLYDMSHYMSEVPLDMITEFETAGQLEASRERVGLADRVRSLGWENLRVRALLCIERDRVDILRHHMALSQEEFYQVRRDRDDTRRRLRRLESLVERRFGFRCKTMTITHSGMTSKAIEELINRRVEETLAAYEATHVANALEDESQSQNGSDGDNGNGRNGNGGNENGGNGNGGNGNPNENDKGERKELLG
ncbi:hypothetical protein Tco_1050684, partial [Tanacetum coccineum]